jgi:hypothetical protein
MSIIANAPSFAGFLFTQPPPATTMGAARTISEKMAQIE